MLLLLQVAFMLIALRQDAGSNVGEPQNPSPYTSAEPWNPISLTRTQREQALREAVLHDDLRRARALLQAGTSVRLRIHPSYYSDGQYDIFAPTKRGKEPTLLMFAVAQHRQEMVDLLLSKRAPVNDIGSSLVIETASEDWQLIGWLENGTALHIAVMEDDFPMMERLLKAGASVKIRDADGYTPLHLAVMVRDLPFTVRLIQARANVNSAAKHGKVPLKMAAERGYQELYDALKRAGAVGDYPVRGTSNVLDP